MFADLTGTFPQFMGSQLIWLTILLACMGVSAGEIILRYLQDYWEQEERDKYDAINEEQKKLQSERINEFVRKKTQRLSEMRKSIDQHQTMKTSIN